MKKAQEQAEFRILTGPDSPGKRWLRNYVARRAAPVSLPVTDKKTPPNLLGMLDADLAAEKITRQRQPGEEGDA